MHGGAGEVLQPLSENDVLLSLQMALKCADLGHVAAPLPLHLKWVQALEHEFFLQGDRERALGLPVSPLCDRNTEGVFKSQVRTDLLLSMSLSMSTAAGCGTATATPSTVLPCRTARRWASSPSWSCRCSTRSRVASGP